QTESIATVSPVRLFTSNQEITDTQIIRKFVNDNTFTSFAPFIILNSNEQVFNYVKLRISFISSDSAIVERYPLAYPQFTGPIENHMASYRLTTTGNLYIREKDTIQYSHSLNIIPRCQELLNMSLFDYNPDDNCMPSGMNWISCKFLNSFTIKKVNQNLSLPLIVTIIKSGNQCLLNTFHDEWDFFNPNILTQLQITDTIAIQTKELFLQKL
ncbi:MAG TPA: hypothetical protein PLO70_11330, partial [Chitinophagaceae bacterium]|nr:hypothetical protein [Chitinophagaceae bacterium]